MKIKKLILTASLLTSFTICALADPNNLLGPNVSIGASRGSEVDVEDRDGENVVTVKYDAKNYPGVSFKQGSEGMDLGEFRAIEATITNTGNIRTSFTVRIDNDGDWSGRPHPYNAEAVALEPGETQTVRVTFGKTFGKTGYELDPGRIVQILVMANSPKEAGTFEVRSVTGVEGS